MASTNQLTILVILLISPTLVLSQPPYYFNQQPQPHRFQYNPYQPFTNAPNYYQPTYQSHVPRGSSSSGGSDLINNYYSSDPTPASSPVVTFPTQESTVRGAPSPGTFGLGHQFSSPQVYQPIGNNLLQQTPTVPTTTLAGNNEPFRPSPLINHHTHIVNGLPRQQFFGNNYEFFRQRHGLTNLPATSGPFSQPQRDNALSTVNPQLLPSPTPSILLSQTSTAQPSTKASEAKPSAVRQVNVARPTPTQPTIVSRFPSFNSFLPFSPAPSLATQTASTTATPARSISTPQPTSSGVSPAFAFSQFFPESDTNGSNELVRQPLFQDDEEEEVDDDEDGSYTLTNNNKNLYIQNGQQQQFRIRPFPSPTPIIPHQRSVSPPATSSPVPSSFKSQSFSNTVQNDANTYNTQSKDEPAPVRIHNTTPIRIVFNYEQALEALQENPGVRVVVAHTEKNNLTHEETTTTRSISSNTTPRPTSSQILYQSTTSRPTATVTYRPSISTTERPRFDYQYGSVPYSVTGRTTTTAAALENLALELEGRFGSTGRPSFPSPRPTLTETVATFATEPTPTEDPLQTYRRGSKKYVVVPNGRNVIKAQQPRVVVNDLANILVQDIPSNNYNRPYYSPTRPTFLPRPSYAEYDEVDNVGQPVGDDLKQEIENLSQQLEIATTIPPSTTTTTTTPPPPPPPRIRVTSTAPLLRITTYRPPGTYRTTPRQAPRVVEEEEREIIDEIPENGLSQELPRNQSPRYYYNNRPHGGLSGAYQRYEYNGDSPSAAPPSENGGPVRRRQRVRGRLIAGSPPRPVQVSAGPSSLGPVAGGALPPDQLQLGPVPVGGQLSPVPAGGTSLPGPVFRVGPRGRLLRRKVRPRTQQPTAAAPPTTPESPPPSPSSFAPAFSAPVGVPDLPPVPQELSSDGPQLYSPSPFIPNSVPFPVTTFRPEAVPNLLVQQNLVGEEQDDDRRVVNRQNTFRSRFRFSPSRPTSTTQASIEEEDEENSSQYESEEEAPVPQRRRPQFSTTTSTTEKPSSNQVLSDRANILQRQIRFNRNRKNNQRSNNNA